MLLTFRQHAIQRMFERSIAPDEIRAALAHGSVIESYPDDTPYPSQLWLGYADTRPLHIVYADDSADQQRIIITVYQPDPAQWTPDLKTRRQIP
jgi:hypothetical protein